MQKELLTMGEMCRLYDATARALRFYESKGLLFPIRRGNHRMFTRRDQARVKLIHLGQRFGFSLQEIRRLIELYHHDDGPRRQLEAAVEAAQTQLDQMIARRSELDGLIAELKVEMGRVAGMLKGSVSENAKGDVHACA